jgi:AcrR family transcriptional regulator
MPPANTFSTAIADARWVRSRAALAQSILALAADKDIEDITASEVAQGAAVNRSTFYKHAKNPAELLRSVLKEDLEVIRLDMLREMLAGDPRRAIRGATHRVLEHVVTNKDIYGSALGASQHSALHQLLSGHIEHTFELVFARGFVTLPFEDDPAATGARFTARFIAHGTVGAIDAWLSDSDDLNIEEFMERFVYQMPAWWPPLYSD